MKLRHLVTALLCCAAASCQPAFAKDGNIADGEWIVEFSVGYKLPTSSALFNPLCDTVNIPATNPMFTEYGNPNYQRLTASCGGNNPIFIGWPIAYEWDDCVLAAVTCRLGWFHLSSWFDGGNALNFGDGHELQMDVVAFSFRYSITKRRELRWNR